MGFVSTYAARGGREYSQPLESRWRRGKVRKGLRMLMATFLGCLIKTASFNLCVWDFFIYRILSGYNTAVSVTVTAIAAQPSHSDFHPLSSLANPHTSSSFAPVSTLAAMLSRSHIYMNFLAFPLLLLSSALLLPCLPFQSVSRTFGGGFLFTEMPKPPHGWLS